MVTEKSLRDGSRTMAVGPLSSRSPFAVFKHNFQGNSHQTGNFVEGAMAYSVGLRASYLNSLEAEVQYTEYYGAGQNNSGRDRDNVGVNLKYSF